MAIASGACRKRDAIGSFPVEQRANACFIPYQDDLEVELGGCKECAGDNFFRGVVATHRIDGDACSVHGSRLWEPLRESLPCVNIYACQSGCPMVLSAGYGQAL